ncbi:MAG: hypothetical protein QXK26_03350 [Candidatus Bathyarchaeia archaeon]
MKKTLASTLIFCTLILAFNISTAVFAQGNIESCNYVGDNLDTFNVGDKVYVKGSGLEPGSTYNIYIVTDYSPWKTSETHISDLYIIEGPITIDVDADGNIENQPVLIWDSANLGNYDIWADSQTNGEIDYYDESDAIDDFDINGAGFIVIGEIFLATIPILFSCLFVAFLKRRYSHWKTCAKA